MKGFVCHESSTSTMIANSSFINILAISPVIAYSFSGALSELISFNATNGTAFCYFKSLTHYPSQCDSTTLAAKILITQN